MASTKLALTIVALWAVSCADACQLTVEVIYPGGGGGTPVPVCGVTCEGDQEQEATYFSGTAFKTFPDLTERFDQMVAVEYENGALKQCDLVPYQSGDELKATEEDCTAQQSSCPEDFTLVGEYCYLISPDVSTQAKGVAYCLSLGAHAGVIDSQQQMDQLAAFLPITVYLGLNDRVNEGTFAYPGRDSVSYFYFNDGEPNNVNNEDCVVAKGNKDFKWNDVQCSKKFNTLCQMDAVPVCATGKQFDDNTCFMTSGPDAVGNYQDGVNFCADRGMTLATINSQLEHDFVAAMLETDSWIGLNDLEQEGVFTWSDGAALEFSSWNEGEPNNQSDEDCVEMKQVMGYMWNDAHCEINVNQFVCRGPKVLV